MSDEQTKLGDGVPIQALPSDVSAVVAMSDLIAQVERTTEPAPPRLTDDPTLLQPTASGLHASLLSTSMPAAGAEAWQALIEELAEESRRSDDESLRAVMLAEAGRILIDRLGRQDEGELLLRRSDSRVADVLRKTDDNTTSLAGQLAGLEATGRDETAPRERRAAAWIEFGQLCEERTPSRKRAYDAFREALTLCPDHPVALPLAINRAVALGERSAACDLLRRQLKGCKSARQRVALLLDLAALVEDPAERLVVLEQAHHTDPAEETALRRLSRALSASGDREQLGDLYRELASIADDPISASTALHLAFLSLTEAGQPVDDLVIELASRAPERADSTDVLAPLAEVALFVERRIAAGDDPNEMFEGAGVLERLSRCLDDPREQALVREELARLRLARLRAEQTAAGTSAEDTKTDPSEDRNTLFENLEADLRFCLVHLPEHRWVQEALAELLEVRGNLPSLVLHLQEWARTQSAGPGRAAILLRLGRVHERKRHDLARAAEIYELAVAEDPDNPDCLRALGQVYEKMRRWPQAVACLRRQAEESDDESQRLAALRRVAALADNELGDVDLAIASLETIAQQDPDDLLSIYQLAKLCRTHRRPTVLITALERLFERIDDEVARTTLLVELGEVWELQLKKRDEARKCYEQALATTPGYTPALRALSRLYRDNGDLEELIRLFDPRVDTVTDPAVLALKAGRVCFEEIGDTDRAIEFLYKAYHTNPDLGPAREMLLQLLTASGRILDAYDLLRAQDFPKSAPLCADHHYRLGLLAEAAARLEGNEDDEDHTLTREDAALQHYRAALVEQPNHGLAFGRSRRLLAARHDVANLIRLTEQVVETEQDGAKAVYFAQLGRLHLTEGDRESARKAYESALGAMPGDPVIRREYEGLLRLLDDRRSLPALNLRSARDTADTHLKATLLVEAAELLLSTGAKEDHDVAGKAILEALQVDPGNPYAVRHLERLLSEPDSSFVIKDAVSARAVRAQSEAERAIFYVESAELLERVGAWGQARRAYLAAKGALPNLAPAELGLTRTSSEKRRATAATAVRTSIHVLVAEARDAAVAAGRGDATARNRAIEVIGRILRRDPQNRDGIALARTLAGQIGEAGPVIDMLADAFRRLEDPDLTYELGLFLGENSLGLEDAVQYYEAAAKAKPQGRRALRGLVNSYRQMGDDRKAAAATERLLELFEPGEPSAIDLRMGIANFLSTSPETLPRAREHARIVLAARPDDNRAIQLMADLLERSGQRVEAADLLDRLVTRERNRERLHDIYLRKARLLADTGEHDDESLDAIERAAAINPGNRDTITLLVEQLGRTGQTSRVATYLSPIRSALVANIARGAVSLRDLRLLATVAEHADPQLSHMALTLLHGLEPTSIDAAPEQGPQATLLGLRRLLETPSLRSGLYAEDEPGHLHGLLQALDGVVARLGAEFPVVRNADGVPVPPGTDTTSLLPYARRLADIVGIRAPRLAASAEHNAAILLVDPVCTIRLGTNLWSQGHPEAHRGLIALAMSRAAFSAPRARSLSPANLDLLLSACFEVVDVFNPMTAETDPDRFKQVVANLRNVMPRRQRKLVELACHNLVSHAFDKGTTARATTATDLHLAAIISGNAADCLAAACLLDGVVGGTLKQRVNRSQMARSLMIHLISDEFLAARKVATAT